MRLISLALALFLFWLALSGHYTPTLIDGWRGFGDCFASWSRCAWASPIGKGTRSILSAGSSRYFPWILREIAKSAWAVTKIIVNPALPISPTMTASRQARRPRSGSSPTPTRSR